MTDNLMDRFLEELGKELKNKPTLPVGDPSVDRLPVVFVIDHSDSTRESGDIVQINEFLKRFADSVCHATNEGWKRIRQHLDFCIVGYSEGAAEVLGWTPGSELSAPKIPTLVGSGRTAMGAGLELASNAMMRRLADYRARSLPCYRGYIFNITDGNPTDMAPADGADASSKWSRIKRVLDSFETKSSTGTAYAQTFHMASRKANRELLGLLAFDPSRVIDLEQANFDELFEFIRVSLLMTFE
ncbi:VWA domain-containing protein [Bradyrhizobium sp. Cp5.3]|uniref:vWA domain-containing protein n=1 Tax=Bradyrhizobium sp. Cp5.3 TaxID=443598 RepID=UPI00048808E7|nr:VWA domain-containing protein [Bradyrhizobium sp. Cp5.3]